MTKEKRDVYQIITDIILERLERGDIPWEKPWVGYRNGVSKRNYSGLNTLLLSGCNYGSVDFFTYKQIQKLGGKIKEDELKNSHMITFWKISKFLPEGVDADSLDADEQDGAYKTSVLLRYYRVWNREQCEGLPDAVADDAIGAVDEDSEALTPYEAAERVVAEYEDGPTIAEGEQQAYYLSKSDHVNMPKRGSFKSHEAWYSTLFHELAHSTGHRRRLNREDMKTYRGESRAREELCAEIAASFLCGEAGIARPVIDNTVAYIQSWIKALKDDKKCVAIAAQAAQKAANWILGRRDLVFGHAKAAEA